MLHNFAFKKRLHHLCAAAIAIFSYLLSGDECKAVIKTLESKSPAITPSNGQHQTAGMFCQMSRKLHKITDHRTYSSAMYFLPAGSILLFQRFLPYDSKDIICDHCQLQHQFVALKLSQRESFNIPTDVTGNDTAGMVAGMVASGVTAKGLNGIEAEVNKLAKAPKGIDGVTEGVGNLAEDVGKVVETSYGKSSLIELKNTDNFMDSTIEHIFEGNVRRGKAGGYHYECIKDTAGNIVNGTEVLINDLGVYKAQVEVNGIPKSGNGGYSTFFHKEMSPQDVIDSINEAYNNKVFVVGSKNSYIGISNNGLEIEMYINNNGKIISAFPKE